MSVRSIIVNTAVVMQSVPTMGMWCGNRLTLSYFVFEKQKAVF